MKQIKKKVEALLFTTGNFMTTEEIAKLTSISSTGTVKQALQELKQDYETKDSSLTIYKENNKFKLGIKKEFNYLTTQLLENYEMDNSTLKTLAIIAYKHPILQSKVVKARGNFAYEHIKNLKEQQFITAEKHGRTRILKLTTKFFDYFDLVEDQLKSKLSNVKEELTESEIKAVLDKLPKPQK